jgi:RNA polymerase sigma-70 factor (ECF subfamily)
MVVSPAQLSDESLAAAAAAGDDHAFEILVERYQARVYRLACRMTSDTEAPDILQDTFLQVHKHLPNFRGDAQVGTWIYRIATNACLMHRRAQSRRPAESLDAFEPTFDSHGRHEDVPAALQVAVRAEERLDQAALARHARSALARLPDLYREAFVLRDLEELSTADVAAALGVEPATVRQRVHRARLLLRGYLQHLVEARRD